MVAVEGKVGGSFRKGRGEWCPNASRLPGTRHTATAAAATKELVEYPTVQLKKDIDLFVSGLTYFSVLWEWPFFSATVSVFCGTTISCPAHS